MPPEMGEDEESIQAYRFIIERKHLLISAPAAGPIWTRAVRSIIPLLEARAQSGAAAKYRASP
jgi:hypothetical protein